MPRTNIRFFGFWSYIYAVVIFLAPVLGAEEVAVGFRPMAELGSVSMVVVNFRPIDAAKPSSEHNIEKGDESRRWLRSPVSFEANKRSLADLLRDFAARQGVAARVSPSLTGSVTGTFAFADPAEFLEIMCQLKQMNWYFDGGTVYFFSNSEIETRLFPLLGKSEQILKQTLGELGFFNSHFEWRSADDGRLLMVQGPEVYLSRITEVMQRLGDAERAELEERVETPREKTLGVFRLKHAWAAEKTITTGDTNTTVPGVADVLRQILSQSTSTQTRSFGRVESASGTPRLIKGSGVIGRANASSQPELTVDEGDEVPFIQADTRINAVLVWDFEERLARYRSIIEALDRPLELVEIRAAIIDVETDRTRELGFSWEYRGENPNWENNAGINVGDSSNRPLIPVVGDGFQYATIYRHGLDSFMAKVNLLEKDGEANILSRPSVLTQDNIQAVLEHTDTFYVRLQGRDEVDLADIKTGLTLKVTPHVIMNGDPMTEDCYVEGIQLAVHIVNGSNTADSSAQQVDNLPRVKQSTITTQAVVGEGEALVIGGYYNETRSVTHSGVPGLSRIPGLGALFRNKTNIANKSERLFVLSPRIVRSGDVPLLPGTEGERLLETSPGRDGLNVPAIDAKTFQPKSREKNR